MQSYVVALSPLFLALTALVVVFPIGLHYAKLERTERRTRTANLQESHLSSPLMEHQARSIFTPTGMYLHTTSGTYLLTVGHTLGHTHPPQSQTAPSSTQVPEQPLPKAA